MLPGKVRTSFIHGDMNEDMLQDMFRGTLQWLPPCRAPVRGLGMLSEPFSADSHGASTFCTCFGFDLDRL